VKVRDHNGVAIIAPHGWLMGGDETDAFQAAVQQALESGHANIVIDLVETEMLNSTAIGVVAGCHRSCEERGGRMVLCNVDRRIQHTMVVMGLALRFQTCANEREALAFFAAPTVA
jgi:anti-anti-sigma factor